MKNRERPWAAAAADSGLLTPALLDLIGDGSQLKEDK
jgi:hypothetical protein